MFTEDLTAFFQTADFAETGTLSLSTSGTAQGGSATSLTMKALASAIDSAYNGMTLSLNDGSGRSRVISGYVGATRVATVPTWAATYLNLPGEDGDYASTPDSVGNSVLGDIDLRQQVAVAAPTLPAFFLPLKDAGAGAVDLTLARGTGVATFTRAGATATTVLSNGLVSPVIGANVARSYYDPTTLEYRGYLAEGARTNLCLQSEDYSNASWGKTDTTVTTNATTAPDGNLTADLLTEGVVGTAAVAQLVTVTANVNHVFSFWAKTGNNQFINVQMWDTGGPTNRVQCTFDLANGLTGTPQNIGLGTGAAATIKVYPNGWCRCTLAGNPNNGGTSLLAQSYGCVSLANSGRVNNSTRYQWGGQVEDNTAFASSYIPTTTVAVTRNADLLTYPSAGNLAATGTAYAEIFNVYGASNVAYLVGGNNNGRMIWSNNGTNSISMSNGANTASYIGNSIATAVRKVASAWADASRLAIVEGGGAVASSATAGTLVTTSIEIAHRGGNNDQPFGTIGNVMIWGPVLADATLQKLTRSVAYPVEAKWVETANQRSYALALDPNGFLRLLVSTDGTAAGVREFVSVPFSYTAGVKFFIRATLDIDDGAGHSIARFYTSPDGVTYTQQGSDVQQVSVSGIFNSTAPLEIGSYDGGKAGLASNVYYAEVRNLIAGSIVASFDPLDGLIGGTSLTSSRTGEVWTVNQSGSPVANLAGAPDATTLYSATGSATIQVIFDNDYFESAIGDAGVAGRTPQCAVADNQLRLGDGAKRNDSLVINSVTYKIREIHADGTGVSRLLLGV
jgi:hypothetical protein